RIYDFDRNFDGGVLLRIDPRARIEIQQQAEEAAGRARDATRRLREQLERCRYDFDRRADDGAPTTIAPTPAPRARGSTRIASAGIASGYGDSTSTGKGDGSGVVAHAREDPL